MTFLISRLRAAMLVPLLAVLAACGGGSDGDSSTTTSTTTTPTPTLQSIALTPANAVISVGTSQQLTATGTYSDGKTAAITSGITWSAAGTSLLTVFNTGLVTGKAAGIETVTASVGSVSGTTKITVKAPWAVVSAGGYHTVARKSDGTAWSWGNNRSGQLGDGSSTDRIAPVNSGTLTNFTQVSAGEYHTLAVTADGKLYAWGFNQNGQLGDGTTTDRAAPKQIGTATKWVAVSAGKAHSLGLQSDGSLWVWGRNFNGQLGDGTTVDRTAPTRIAATVANGSSTSAANWVAISAGDSHSVARLSTGRLYAWGSNAFGQAGQGTTATANAQYTEPTAIGTATWVAIDAGGDHTLAIRSDGALFSWGANGSGQLGADAADTATAPVQVGEDTNWATISAGGKHSLAILHIKW